MDMHLQRFSKEPDGIFSKLMCQNGQLGVTIEHSYDYGDGLYEPIIGPGIYNCKRGMHQLHDGTKFETFEITGVDGHSGLLFHWGNKNKDSEGCVLTGEKKVEINSKTHEDMVTNSRATFAKFMKLQEGCDSFRLTVEDMT